LQVFRFYSGALGVEDDIFAALDVDGRHRDSGLADVELVKIDEPSQRVGKRVMPE
jgi:hypothetical protein